MFVGWEATNDDDA